MSKSKPYPVRDELPELWVTIFHRSYVPGDGCWTWMYARDGKGYGVIWFKDRLLLAHRVMYALMRGSVSEDKCVCHRCDNPACVRPDHLFLGTHQENMDDRTAKGRTGPRKGVHNGNAKLDDAKVRQARAMRSEGMTYSAIGLALGVSWKTAAQVCRGERWSHVT